MKKTRILSTTLITLASILAVVFCVLMGVFFTNKTSRPNNSNPNLDAAAPEGNWVDYAVQPATGSGTQSDPWHIKTAAELAYVAVTVTGPNGPKFYLYLDTDIDLGAHKWKGELFDRPGTHFYGQNHTISNLFSDEFNAFIMLACEGEIRDITFTNVQMKSSIIGTAWDEIISNVHVKSGEIGAENISNAAGVVASIDYNTIIQNCSNGADIIAEGYAGGIVANVSNSIIENCINTGIISASYGGGIAGVNLGSTIKNCKNTGVVSGMLIGGGICEFSNGIIENCFYKVNTELGSTGQLVGEDEGEIIDCSVMFDYWTDYAVEPTVGSGTSADPWHIYSAEELAYLAATATSSSNFYAYLEADIDLFVHDLGAEYLYAHEWVPIGSSETPINSIHLYGQNHTISNMYIDAAGEYSLAGWIGFIYTQTDISSEIRDINFKNVEISCEAEYELFAGAVIGYCEGNLTCDNINIENGKVCIKDGSSPMDNSIGGIVGYSEGHTIIQNCTYSGVVTGMDCAGGIIGCANIVEITNCNTYGAVSGGYCCGGIAGFYGRDGRFGEIVKDCNNYATVTGASDYVGGIVGQARYQIKNCNNYGAVTGTSNYVGGIVGQTLYGLVNCNNTGAVTGTSNYVGGIAGNAGCEIQNCNNYGSVSGKNYVGGITGYDANSITSCTNSGVVTSSSDYVGGIVGQASSGITGCYNSGTVNGANYAGGIVGMSNGTIQKCTNVGNIIVKTQICGGIIGTVVDSYGDIKNCINLGQVKATGMGNIGGIVGRISNSPVAILDCYNGGILSGRANNGGIVGNVANTNGLQIIRSFNGGNLTRVANLVGTGSGGIVGYCGSASIITIKDSVFRGSVSSSPSNLKPLVFVANGGAVTCVSCYYDYLISSTEYKGYILSEDETEATAFSSDIWVLNSSTEMSSMPVPKSLAWVGEYLENNTNILQFLKDKGFTQAAA